MTRAEKKKLSDLPTKNGEVVGAWAEAKRQHQALMASNAEYREAYEKADERINREQAEADAKLVKSKARMRKARKEIPGFKDREKEFVLMVEIRKALLAAKSGSGLSQRDIAKKLGMLQPAVSRIETATNISFKSFVAYLAACGYTAEIAVKKIAAK